MSHNLQSIPTEGLSIPQIEALACLSAGRTIAEVARDIDISRQSIYNWQKDPKFNNAYNIGKQLYAADFRDHMVTISRKALNRLEAILDDPKAPHGVALKAALAVLNRPQFPDPGWNLPVNINTPRQDEIQEMSLAVEIDMKQAELENLQRKLMMAKIKAETAAPPPAPASTGQNLTPSQPVNPIPRSQEPNPAQPQQTQPQQTQPTGQNLTSNHVVHPQASPPGA